LKKQTRWKQTIVQKKEEKMNEQFQDNEPLDRQEARRQRREERRELGGSTWIAGVILVVLGGIFLVRNTGILNFSFTNWWALFILIPALGSLDKAFRAYRNAGNQLTTLARNSFFVGLFLTFLCASFLFSFNWSLFGPILLILLGAGVLVKAMIPVKE